MKAVPAVALRREHPIGLGLHVEGAIPLAVLSPLETIGLAGVQLAQVAGPIEGLDASPGAKISAVSIARGSVLANSTSARTRPGRQPVPQRFRLAADRGGQTGATPLTADHPGEPGHGIAVTNQHQPHASPP